MGSLKMIRSVTASILVVLLTLNAAQGCKAEEEGLSMSDGADQERQQLEQEAFGQVEALLASAITGSQQIDTGTTTDSLATIVKLAGDGLLSARQQLVAAAKGAAQPESSRTPETRALTLAILEQLLELKALSGEPGSGDKFNQLSEQFGNRLLVMGNRVQVPSIERLLVALVAIKEDASGNRQQTDSARHDEEKSWFRELWDKIF